MDQQMEESEENPRFLAPVTSTQRSREVLRQRKTRRLPGLENLQFSPHIPEEQPVMKPQGQVLHSLVPSFQAHHRESI